MNWRSKGLKWAVALAVVALAGVAWTQWKKANPPPEVPRYRTAAVDRGAISQAVLANGTVQPVNTVNVGTQVSGTVLERSADFNDRARRALNWTRDTLNSPAFPKEANRGFWGQIDEFEDADNAGASAKQGFDGLQAA